MGKYELFSPEPFETRVSAVIAMAMTLPMVEFAARFPGVAPWLRQLPEQLGPRALAD